MTRTILAASLLIAGLATAQAQTGDMSCADYLKADAQAQASLAEQAFLDRGQAEIKAREQIELVAEANRIAAASQEQAASAAEEARLASQLRASVEDAAKKAMEHGVRNVTVYVKGPGSGRESALRALNAAGFKINLIRDVTPVPHNGCRPRKRRRV